MGYSKIIFCENCKFEKQFFIGVGMMYDYLEHVIDKKDKRYKDILKLRKYFKKNKEEYKESISKEIYVCSDCGNLENNLDIKIESEKFTHHYNYSCSRCNAKLEKLNISLLEKDVLKIICPECKSSNTGHKKGDIRWD